MADDVEKDLIFSASSGSRSAISSKTSGNKKKETVVLKNFLKIRQSCPNQVPENSSQVEAQTVSTSKSKTAETKHCLSSMPEETVFGRNAGARLKLALTLVQKSEDRVKKVTEERDFARKLLKDLFGQFQAVREKTAGDLKRLEESFRDLRDTETGYLENIRRRFEAEKVMLNDLIAAFEKNKKNLEAQLECKKQQLAQLKVDIDKEVSYQDHCKKEMYKTLARNEQLAKQMQDKLYLGVHSHCGNCQARKRVAEAMENQIVRKAEENTALKKQKEEADKRVAEKDRISNIFMKENERLKFELSETKKSIDRRLDMARQEWEQKLEETLQAVALETQDDPSVKTPSPPSSESDCATTSATENNPAETPGESTTGTPVYGNPFAAWEKRAVTPSSTPNTSELAPGKDRKRPHTPCGSVGAKTPREGDAVGGKTPRDGAFSAPVPKKQKSEQKDAKPPPPPPPPPPPKKAPAAADVKNEPISQPEPDDWPTRDWLLNQMEGMENLVGWYRKQLKNMTDDLTYFQGRLEEDTDTIENHADQIRKRETDCEKLRRELNSEKSHVGNLREQLRNLALSVTSYIDSH